MANASVALIGLLACAPALAATLRPGDFVMATRSVADYSLWQVVTLDAASAAVSEVASGGYLLDPADIAVNGRGDILVTTAAYGIVRIDAASGQQSVFASLAALGGEAPVGLCVASDGGAYVTSGARVLRLSGDGSVAGVVSSGGLLQSPAGLAGGPDGMLYVCETQSPMITSNVRGSLVRVDPGSGAQTLIAAGAPIYSPFDLAFGADGSLWSVQRGYLFAGYEGCIVKTRMADGTSEQDPWGYCRAKGIAIRPDGLTIVADCVPIHGDCSYPLTKLYSSGPTAFDLAGPLTVVPDLVTPTTRTTWGRVKSMYR